MHKEEAEEHGDADLGCGERARKGSSHGGGDEGEFGRRVGQASEETTARKPWTGAGEKVKPNTWVVLFQGDRGQETGQIMPRWSASLTVPASEAPERLPRGLF